MQWLTEVGRPPETTKTRANCGVGVYNMGNLAQEPCDFLQGIIHRDLRSRRSADFFRQMRTGARVDVGSVKKVLWKGLTLESKTAMIEKKDNKRERICEMDMVGIDFFLSNKDGGFVEVDEAVYLSWKKHGGESTVNTFPELHERLMKQTHNRGYRYQDYTPQAWVHCPTQR